MIEPDEVPKELRGWLIGKWAVLMTGVVATLGTAVSSAVLVLAIKAYDRLDAILIKVVPEIRESLVKQDGRIDGVSGVVMTHEKRLGIAESNIFVLNGRIR